MNFRQFKEKYQKKEVEEISFSPPREPIVSVLVQTYQQKNFITECLDSILMQETSFDFEILVGDDGSTDGTREICLQYTESYPDKIRMFLHHRENQIQVLGEATSNFNAFYNFYSARGKYIAFCEGDDKWTDPMKLDRQIKFLKMNSSFSFSYHKFEVIDKLGNRNFAPIENEQVLTDINRKDLIEVAYHPLLLTICFEKDSLCIPKEIFNVLNIDTFLLSLFGEVGKAKFQKEISPSFYRIQTEGVWSKKVRTKKLLSKIETYRFLANYYERTGKDSFKNHFLSKMRLHYRMLIVSHWQEKKFILAGKTILDYIKG